MNSPIRSPRSISTTALSAKAFSPVVKGATPNSQKQQSSPIDDQETDDELEISSQVESGDALSR
jgi:hypothetical protein